MQGSSGTGLAGTSVSAGAGELAGAGGAAALVSCKPMPLNMVSAGVKMDAAYSMPLMDTPAWTFVDRKYLPWYNVFIIGPEPGKRLPRTVVRKFWQTVVIQIFSNE